jgi:uncharacterized phage infection (PIP) family protein YhgE
MAAITSAAVAVAGGAYQAISSAKQARDAKDALNNLKTPELTNVAEGLQVSTLGSDLQREELGRQYSTGVDALRSGGIRGVIGGLGTLNTQQNLANRQIASDLDMQQKQIDQIRAQDEQRIQGVKEQRYQGDVAALSSQYNAGQQGLMQGISGMAQGVASGAQMVQSNSQFKDMMNAYSGAPNAVAGAPTISGLTPVGFASTSSGNFLSPKLPTMAGLTYSNIPTTNFKIK